MDWKELISRNNYLYCSDLGHPNLAQHRKLKIFISDVFWVLQNVSPYLFVNHFYISIFYNIFFYTQLVFDFIFRKILISFMSIFLLFFPFRFCKDFNIFHKTFFVVFILVKFSLWIFRNLYICEKKYIKKVNNKKIDLLDLKMQQEFYKIQCFCSLHNIFINYLKYLETIWITIKITFLSIF